MLNISGLLQLIQNDTQAKGFYSAGNDEQCAKRCSEISSLGVVAISGSLLRLELAKRGKLGKLLRVLISTGQPEALFDACATLNALMNAETPIMLNEPVITNAFNVLVQSNLLSAADVTALNAFASAKPQYTHHNIGVVRETQRLTGGAKNGIA